jgi:hypothetical protein
VHAEFPSTDEKPRFQKTEVPCLYRYSSNGVYYALLKQNGKQKCASLETTDKATARRLLRDQQRDMQKVDASQGKLTLEALCARYRPAKGLVYHVTASQDYYSGSAISFIFHDEWPTPESHIRVKKLDSLFEPGTKARFWLNRRRDEALSLFSLDTHLISKEQVLDFLVGKRGWD